MQQIQIREDFTQSGGGKLDEEIGAFVLLKYIRVTEDDLPKSPNGRRAFFITVDFRNILQNEMGFAKRQVKGTCTLCHLEKRIMDEL